MVMQYWRHSKSSPARVYTTYTEHTQLILKYLNYVSYLDLD